MLRDGDGVLRQSRWGHLNFFAGLTMVVLGSPGQVGGPNRCVCVFFFFASKQSLAVLNKARQHCFIFLTFPVVTFMRLLLFCVCVWFFSSVSRFGKRGTVVGGMSDQPFSTSVNAAADGQGGGIRNRRHADWLLSLRLVTATAAAESVPDGDQPGYEGVAGILL